MTVENDILLKLKDDNNTMVNGQSISSILSSNTNYYRSGWFNAYQNPVVSCVNFIFGVIDQLSTALINAGYDRTRTSKAIEQLKDYYNNLMADIISWRPMVAEDYDGNAEHRANSFDAYTFTGKDGAQHSIGQDAFWKEYQNAYDITGVGELSQVSGIGISHSRNGEDLYQVGINTKILLERFADFYRWL